MKKSTIIYTVANLICLIWCVYFVMDIRSDANAPWQSDFQDSLRFMIFVVPVFYFCLFIDIIWGFTSLVAFIRRRDYRPAIAWGTVVVIWVATYLSIRYTA